MISSHDDLDDRKNVNYIELQENASKDLENPEVEEKKDSNRLSLNRQRSKSKPCDKGMGLCCSMALIVLSGIITGLYYLIRKDHSTTTSGPSVPNSDLCPPFSADTINQFIVEGNVYNYEKSRFGRHCEVEPNRANYTAHVIWKHQYTEFGNEFTYFESLWAPNSTEALRIAQKYLAGGHIDTSKSGTKRYVSAPGKFNGEECIYPEASTLDRSDPDYACNAPVIRTSDFDRLRSSEQKKNEVKFTTQNNNMLFNKKSQQRSNNINKPKGVRLGR